VSLLFSVLKDRILQSVQHSPSSRTFSALQRICGSADVPEKRNLRVPLNLDHVTIVIYALANLCGTISFDCKNFHSTISLF
jgi:hypothetical protein